MRKLVFPFLLLAFPALALAAHGYALWGEMKYPPGFAHFSYVNPDAPKGGELRLVSNLRYSTFDKYNPFTIKGSPPAYLGELVFDTLLTGPMDETGTGYGLLAESVDVASDRLSATFRLRQKARFSNGDPVLAADVVHTFETLISIHAQPGFRTMLAEVDGVDALDERTVRFRFKTPNRELPLTVGGLPVFSRKWGEGKPFDQVIMDMPIGSGPYTIGPVKFGRDITYVRKPDYWANDLNVARGMFNFDRITVKIYRDNTARLEALKAGEFDLMRFFSAGDWARRLYGKKFDSGELVKGEFRHRLPTGFQSYVLNTRRPFLQDVRVREALGLAMDYEWMNRQLFYNAYQRVNGLFGHTECQASGLPSPAEQALLEPWRGQIPEAAFGPMVQPPRTDGDASLRANLRRARQLLEEAGWEYRDGKLRNARGQPMVLEYLDSSGNVGGRVAAQWMDALEKLGIELRFRSVDFAIYLERMDNFNFDIISLNFQGTSNPGQEFFELFGSAAADVKSSGNYAGVRSKAVDDLIRRMVQANEHADFLASCRALERVIASSHYLVPQWSATTHRMVYNAWRLQRPEGEMPPYAPGEMWVIATWWARNPPGPDSPPHRTDPIPAGAAPAPGQF